MKAKRKSDARKLDHETLEVLRKRTVEQVLSGESPEILARAIGVNPATVYRWLQLYHYGGWDALKAKPVPGRPPKLSADQMAWIAKTVRGNDPRQLCFPFALWTLGIIREVIRDRFAINLSEVTVGRIMRTLGFSPQRPLYRAYQQDPELVERWRTEEYPKIKKKAKRANALVFFADESSVRSDYHSGHTWAPRGETPVVSATGSRFSVNMISAISPSGKFFFKVHDGTVNSEVFRSFIEDLLDSIPSDKKVYLIVDGHPAHRGKIVREYLRQLKGRVTLYLLPPYSPELNPDEHVWSLVKREIAAQPVSKKADLFELAKSILAKLQESIDKLLAIFCDPKCAYASN